jgi:hypothetical protein
MKNKLAMLLLIGLLALLASAAVGRRPEPPPPGTSLESITVAGVQHLSTIHADE